MSIIRLDEEVEACFRENPELVNKTIRQIAQFFLIQGELKYSSIKNAANGKANFYRMRLQDLDPEYCAKLDKEWREATRLEKE